MSFYDSSGRLLTTDSGTATPGGGTSTATAADVQAGVNASTIPQAIADSTIELDAIKTSLGSPTDTVKPVNFNAIASLKGLLRLLGDRVNLIVSSVGLTTDAGVGSATGSTLLPRLRGIAETLEDLPTRSVQGTFKYTVTGNPAVLDGYLASDGGLFPSPADAIASPPTNALSVGTGAGQVQVVGFPTDFVSSPQAVKYDLGGGGTGLTGWVVGDIVYPSFVDAVAGTNALTLGTGAGEATVTPIGESRSVQGTFKYTVAGSPTILDGYLASDGGLFPTAPAALTNTNPLTIGTAAGQIEVVGLSSGGATADIPPQAVLYDVAGGASALTGWVVGDIVYPSFVDAIAATNPLTLGTAAGEATVTGITTGSRSIQDTFKYTVAGSPTVLDGYLASDGGLFASAADALGNTNPLTIGLAATEIQVVGLSSDSVTPPQSVLYDVAGGASGSTGWVSGNTVYPTFADAVAGTNPLTLGTATGEATVTGPVSAASIKSQDYLYIAAGTDASGLARGQIARQYIAQDAAGTITGSFWVDDSDTPLPAPPTLSNLARAEDGFPDAILVDWDTSDGAGGIANPSVDGFATALNDGTYELFEDYQRTILVPQGTAAGEAIQESIGPRLLVDTNTLAAATMLAQGLPNGQYEEKIQASDYESETTLTAAFTQLAVGASGPVSVADTLGFVEQQIVRIWGHDGASSYRHGTYTVTGISNATTSTTALFTQVATGASVTISVTSAGGFAANDFIWLPDGFYGQITAISGNDITATNQGGQYNSPALTNLSAASRVIRVGAGDVTLQRLDVPLADLQINRDSTNATFTGPIPAGRFLTARSMLDRATLGCTKVFISVAAPRALINHIADPANVNEIWQYASDAVRWQIGAGPMADISQMLGMTAAFNMDHLLDISVVQFFSPIIGDGIQPYVIARYTTGGA